MAVSLCHCNAKLVSESSIVSAPSTRDPRISPPNVESAVPSLPTSASREITAPVSAHSRDKFVDTTSTGYVRWASLAAAAVASVSVLSAAPSVWAIEREVSTGMITNSIPGDLSLSIAIPIPDADTWKYSQYGFLAPPPRVGGEVAVVSNYQAGCPAWQPSQYEMIVPEGVHPKQSPRHGSQWPALYMLEEATIQYPAMNSEDPSVRYASLVDTLIRMSDPTLSCYSL